LHFLSHCCSDAATPIAFWFTPTWAQHNLGRAYNQGAGVAKDSAKAVEWYRKAAEASSGL
jgi:hypothetical protein